MTLKELFSTPNPVKIENNRCRTRPTQCPACRETFYGYERLDHFENRTSDEPYVQPINNPDRLGYIPGRQTCGSSECYIAEERFCNAKSPFFQQERYQPQNIIKRPKGITSLGDLL